MGKTIIILVVFLFLFFCSESFPLEADYTQCISTLDIVLLIDSSESMMTSWNDVIDHAETFSFEFAAGERRSRFGIIDYSSLANVYKPLDSLNSNEATFQILEELRGRPQKSRSAFERGLGWTLEVFALARARENTQKVLIVYTDAEWSGKAQTDAIPEYLGILKQQSIDVYFFLTRELGEDNIISLVSIEYAKSFNILHTRKQDLVSVVCNSMNNVPHEHALNYLTRLNETRLIIENTSSIVQPKEVVNTDAIYSNPHIHKPVSMNNSEETSAQTKPGSKSLATLPKMILYNAVPIHRPPVNFSTNSENELTSRDTLHMESFTQKEEGLFSHNYLRRLHGVEDLGWDDQLAEQARSWAEHLVNQDKKLQSSEYSSQFGENLYMFWGASAAHAYDAALLWYKGIKDYNYTNHKYTWASGTFTQMIWANTNKLGLGVAHRPDIQLTVIVGHYAPPGNYIGQYDTQVLKPIAGLPAVIPDIENLKSPEAEKRDLCTGGHQCPEGAEYQMGSSERRV